MRIDTFMVACVMLVASLLTMIFGGNTLLSNIAYQTLMLSMVAFATSDLFDHWFLRRSKPASSLDA